MRRKLKKLLSILTSRLVIIGLLILIQLAWFLILFLRLTQYATWINAGFVALSLLIELYIINKSGNPSYKILWLLFIGTFPVLGGLMYPVQLLGMEFELCQQGLALLALIPIWLYRGRQGYHSKPFQYLCYAFYPVHMLLLVVVLNFINR